MELAMTRLRRIVRERVGSETPLSVDELSELPWLEMQDAIEAGLADRADMAQAMFMQDLRPIHPEWSAAELRRWIAGGRWQHTILLARQSHTASAVTHTSTMAQRVPIGATSAMRAQWREEPTSVRRLSIRPVRRLYVDAPDKLRESLVT
jgi:hypothetical protein